MNLLRDNYVHCVMNVLICALCYITLLICALCYERTHICIVLYNLTHIVLYNLTQWLYILLKITCLISITFVLYILFIQWTPLYIV